VETHGIQVPPVNPHLFQCLAGGEELGRLSRASHSGLKLAHPENGAVVEEIHHAGPGHPSQLVCRKVGVTKGAKAYLVRALGSVVD
jgi:hypothetical protein